jgi:hypothetical protein
MEKTTLNMGWKKIAITRHRGEKIELKSLPGYWIIPQKFTMDVMTEIIANNGIDLDPKKLEGKTEDEVRDYVTSVIRRKTDNQGSLADTSLVSAIRLSFLNGVYDHNFNTPKNEKGEFVDPATLPDPGDLTQEAYNTLLKEKGIYFEKVKWDIDLFNEMKTYSDTLLEIHTLVVTFNSPLSKQTPEKSAT